MDVDICGPSAPRVMGVEGEQVHQSGSGWSPIVSQYPLELHLINCYSSQPKPIFSMWRRI